MQVAVYSDLKVHALFYFCRSALSDYLYETTENVLHIFLYRESSLYGNPMTLGGALTLVYRIVSFPLMLLIFFSLYSFLILLYILPHIEKDLTELPLSHIQEYIA